MRALIYALLLGGSLWVQVSAQVAPSWLNAATNGGAKALLDGTAAVFANSAAGAQQSKISVELGAGGLGQDIYLWTAGVLPISENAAWGLGIVEPSPGALDQHRVEMTGITRPFVGTWLGARGTFQKNPLDHRVELSMGAYHKITPQFSASWTIENLSESLDSNYLHNHGKRTFGLGFAWGIDRDLRYTLWLDGETQRFKLDKQWWRGAGGFKIDIGAQRNLQLLSGFSLQNKQRSWEPEGALGASYSQQFFSTKLKFSYAVSGVSFKDGFKQMQHTVSLGVVLNAYADENKPMPFVRAERVLISPTGKDSLPQDNIFYLRIEENSGLVENWNLVIYTTDGNLLPKDVVRRFSGAGMPPHAVRWNADDVAGYACPPGVYAYRLIAVDGGGNQNWTEWQHIELR
ncbi:MAG: hypothetical protein GX801_04530 [Fibrobacter sp.]|nr:hypothetical protein [Fibrobacter sp.]